MGKRRGASRFGKFVLEDRRVGVPHPHGVSARRFGMRVSALSFREGERQGGSWLLLPFADEAGPAPKLNLRLRRCYQL